MPRPAARCVVAAVIVVLLGIPALGVAGPAVAGRSSPDVPRVEAVLPLGPGTDAGTVPREGGTGPRAASFEPWDLSTGGVPPRPLSGPLDPNASGSTLDLVNNSLVPGFAPPENQPAPYAIAFDPALDRIFVGSWNLYYGLAIEEVDPVAGAVVGFLPAYNCESLAETGLQYDPNNGLLYALCGPDRLLALDPLDGAIVANLSLGGVSSNCTPLSPFAVALALAPALHDLFALVVGCSNPGPDPLSLDVIDDRSNTVSTNVSLGTTNFSGSPPTQLAEGTPLAFDEASGELYVCSSLNLDTDDVEIAIVNPSSGEVVANLTTPWIGVYPFLVYSPALRAVLAPSWISSHGRNYTGLVRLDPVSGTLSPVVEWPRPLNSTVQIVYPEIAYAGPGDAENVTIFTQEAGPVYSSVQPTAWVFNVSDDESIANFTVGTWYASAGYDSVDGALLLVSGPGDLLYSITGPSPHLGPAIPLGATAFGSAYDPNNGTWYVATSPGCYPPGSGIVTCSPPDPLAYPATLNETPRVDVVPSTVERTVASWPLPPGTVGGLVFDPARDEIFVLSECSVELGPCLPGNGTAAISAFTPSGHEVAQLPIAARSEDWVPEGMAVDSATGAILFTSADGLALTLEAATPSLGSVTPVALLSSRQGLAGSVAFDPTDDVAIAGFYCVNDDLPEACWTGFNGTTLAPVWNLTEPENVVGGSEFGGIAVDPNNGTLLLSNGSGLFVVDPRTGTVTGSFGVPGGADHLSFDPASNVLYFLDGGNLSEMNVTTRTIVGTDPIAGAGFDGSVAVDTSTGVAAVSQALQGCVLFDAGPGPARYSVEFPESGLSEPSTWRVTVGGVGESGSGALTFFLANGTYPYSIGGAAGYTQVTLPATGTIVVNGTPEVEPTVRFRPATVALAFVESGGVDPNGWSLSVAPVTGVPCTGTCATNWSNTSTSRTFSAPNGTYRYLLEGLGSGYELAGAAPTGLIELNGSPVTFHFGFVRGPTPTISFREAGGLGGASWCVRFAQLVERCTLNTSMKFADLSPGVYAFDFLPPSGYVVARGSGAVTLRASSVGVTRPISGETYLVTLVAVGLAPHTRWTVQLDGRTLVGREPFVDLALPNGTYAYTGNPVPGYHGTWSGSVTVNGAAIAVSGVYTPVLYAVTFVEEGLPSGANWSVTVDGVTISSTSSTIVFELRNGTYAFSAAGPSPYTHPSRGSSFRVLGGPRSVAVRFT